MSGALRAARSVTTCSVAAVAACLLAACVPAHDTAQSVVAPSSPDASRASRVYSGYGGNVYITCHSGRLLYVLDGYKAGGLAVVENAPECAQTPPQGAGE